MLILHNSCNDWENNGISIAAIFGVGLIGTYLVRKLLKQQYSIIHDLPFSWQTPQRREKAKADILEYIRYLIKKLDQGDRQCRGGLYAPPNRAGINPATTKPEDNNRTIIGPENHPHKTRKRKSLSCQIDFVWSAGKGGFGMDQRDTLPEMDSFSEVVKMAVAVLQENPSCLVRFHMLSSAGGLFEGQRNVNTATLPVPKRPYAAMKLNQEQILGSCNNMIQFIYRPTSVYGFAGLNRRLGLIPTLLWNGSRNKVSSIFGSPDTLRDYVWADDVGSFIANKILSKESESETLILASGKPSALFEIFRLIEKVLNKKLFCHYIKDGGNTEHNTFNTATYPAGWKPISIETGIRKTFNGMFSNSDTLNNLSL